MEGRPQRMTIWPGLFGFTNVLAICAWIVLAFLPRKPLAHSVVLYLGVALLCLIYVVCFALFLTGSVDIGAVPGGARGVRPGPAVPGRGQRWPPHSTAALDRDPCNPANHSAITTALSEARPPMAVAGSPHTRKLLMEMYEAAVATAHPDTCVPPHLPRPPRPPSKQLAIGCSHRAAMGGPVVVGRHGRPGCCRPPWAARLLSAAMCGPVCCKG